MKRKSILVMICFIFCNINGFAVCKKWSKSKKLGVLDSKIVNEASGLVVSKTKEDTLYHINDSGDGPYFYSTSFDGSETKKITVFGYSPKDVEDLAYGTFKGKNSLFIGDIGDNDERRKNISIVIVEESENFNTVVLPVKILKAKYPDRAHNAEGMAVHPNGDIYILTKEMDYTNNRAAPAELFRISKEQIESSKEVIEMEHIATFELSYILYDFNLFGRIVTAFDISRDGKKIAIMTYKAIIEVDIDLNARNFPLVRDWYILENYSIIRTTPLPQQEAVAYLEGGEGFIYTTEFKKRLGESPIYQVNCLE